MKFKIIIILFISVSCVGKFEHQKNSFSSKTISIKFIEPFTYSNLDTLIIDDKKFTHTYSMDSINNGNYLPKERITLFEIEDKKASVKNNPINIARILSFKLKASGDYKIINIPEVLTKGIIKFQRVDMDTIKVFITEGYQANIKTFSSKSKIDNP